MQNILFLKTYKSTYNINQRLKINSQHKRYMQKARACITVSLTKKSSYPEFFRHNYPGEYRTRRIVRKLTDDEKRRLNITQHEATHYNVENQKTGKIEAILTSAQNKEGTTPAGFDKLDSVKLNGTYTPLKDKKGNFILDAQNNTQPDPNKGGQYMATLSRPRIIHKDVEHLYEIDHSTQAYIDKHEDKILANILKNRKKYGMQLPKYIGGQDDET